MPNVDIITAEVIRNGVNAAAREMGTTLVRTAYNPLLYDVQDYGLAIVSSLGDTWAEAPGMTVFVGAIPGAVRAGLEMYGPDGLVDGDVIIANDPYSTGNHISDVSIYMPVFHEDKLIAFTASVAHWADVGGKTPGGWCPDSTDVYQEGICFNHEKLIEAGEKVSALWRIVRNNTRYPDMVTGDMQAQIAACRLGAERLRVLCRKYGMQTVLEAMDHTLETTDQQTRSNIRSMPDGVYKAQIMMDHDGVLVDQAFPIAIQVKIEGDRILVSFEGTSPVRAGPVNSPEYAVRSVVRAAIKGVISPTEPSNAGDFRSIDFDIPAGLIISPERPAPVDSYGYVCIACYELTMRALSQAIPERCISGGATLCMPTIARVNPRDGKPFILSDPFDVGNGARPYGDGPTMSINVMGDVPNSPIEVVEMRYPLRINRYELREEAAGAGCYRGGAGIIRDYEILEDGITLFTALENTRESIAKGFHSGGDGGVAEVIVRSADGKETVMGDRGPFRAPLKVGDVISMRSGGGGGWGEPGGREPSEVARDVRDERITIRDARDIYKVVLDIDDSHPSVNELETNLLRAVDR